MVDLEMAWSSILWIFMGAYPVDGCNDPWLCLRWMNFTTPDCNDTMISFI